jgi:hypothetical protein
MLASVCLLLLCADPLEDAANRFPGYEEAHASLNLAHAWDVTLAKPNDLRAGAWRIFCLVLDESGMEERVRRDIDLPALKKELDRFDRSHRLNDSSFDAGRMPHPFPLLRACHW